MKTSSKIAVLLLLTGLTLTGSPAVFAADSNSNASFPTVISGYPIPKEIGGLPVISVHTSDDSASLQPGEVRIALLDVTNDPSEPVSMSALPEYLSNLPQGWSISVFSGPNVSKAEYERLFQETNDFIAKYGPGPKSGTVMITSSGFGETTTPPQ